VVKLKRFKKPDYAYDKLNFTLGNKFIAHNKKLALNK
jgi:hypothetical protein